MNERVLRTAGTLLLAVTAAWAGYRIYSSRHPDQPGTTSRGETGPVAAVAVPAGEASPARPSDADTADEEWKPGMAPPAAIPLRLPAVSLRNRDGTPTSLTTWQGKSLIINFWATWCAPCRHEIPLLQALDSEWRGHDVQVVGIAVDTRDKVLAYARELHIEYPLLIGEEDALDAAGAFGVTSPVFPFTVFTDHAGEIVALYVGELHRPQADLILARVQEVNEGRLALPAARLAIAERLHESGDVR